jgi:ribonuclease E
MTKRMLIDATHAEETRVVVLDGNRLEDFDVETSTKKQLKGNIYLAKIVRVEPSLQAAFVEYGGGRHGFLAFGEIHPDYYQIPVADRQRLLAMQAQEAREEEEAEDEAARADGAAEQAAARRDAEAAAEGPASEPNFRDADIGSVAAEAEPVEPESVGMKLDAPEPAPDVAPESVVAAPLGDAVPGAPADPAAPDAPQAPHAETAAPAPELPADLDPPVDREMPAGDAREEPSATAAEPSGDAAIAPSVAPGAAAEPKPPRPAQAAVIPQDVRFADEVFSPGLAEDHVHGGAGFDEVVSDSSAAVLEGAASAPSAEAQPDLDLPGGGEAEPENGDDEGGDEDGADDTNGAGEPPPQTIGGESDNSDAADEARNRRSMRMLRNYRIQEVIRRRQIVLVQVVKEERGTKGAALTTYISLAGRFCVLMPNSPRGGGISRKITSAADRRRLKEITAELDVPAGMGLIVRTAGAARPKPEIKRDAEYLMRLWDDIREQTLKSVAPALIYEEASLIKRSIRDVYSRDIDEILVDGEEGWRGAHDFMRMLMPGHAKKVQLWRPNGGTAPQPLFSKFAVEAQLDAMLSPTVQLKSGGYLVINQTEALVAIDVNSGRSTRERGIEETALRTNLEASDEVARQLRLRDLAGLIVIDYIDMESRKHNALVERRLTEALKNDRARIQVGHISAFGLMEMSRQRLRPSLAETSFVTCPHCAGAGLVRSIESSGVHVLRAIEDEGAKAKASLIMVHCANAIAMYLLNHKRERLAEIEGRYAMRVHFTADESLPPPEIRIDRLRPQVADAERVYATPVLPAAPAFAAEDDVEEAADEVFDEAPARAEPAKAAPAAPRADAPRTPVAETAAESEESARRRRRRRRRGGRRDGADASSGPSQTGESADAGVGDDEGEDAVSVMQAEAEGYAVGEVSGPHEQDEVPAAEQAAPREAPAVVVEEVDVTVTAAVVAGDDQPAIDPSELDENGLPRARRRGRRGGRRRRREPGEEGSEAEAAAPAPAAPVYAPPAYVGPTPADPFGGHAFDIFDMMDEVESRPVARAPARAARSPERVAEPTPEQGSLDVGTPEAPAVAAEAVVETRNEAAPAEHAPEADVAAQPQGLAESVAVSPVAAEPATPDAEALAPPPDSHATQHPLPEPVAESAAPEPPPAPVIQPIVIGATDLPPTERKKGWWRR